MPVFGILGASMAGALSMVLATVLLIPVLSRKIALHLDFRSITKTLFAGCMMAAVLLVVQLVHYSKFMQPSVRSHWRNNLRRDAKTVISGRLL